MWFAVLSTLFLLQSPAPLRIVVTDMEGGAGTLIVTPSGEAILIDCGSRLPDARDARRIANAARRLGLRQIDHLIITHYHRDHWGGVEQLAALIPIRRFYDHGPMARLPEDPHYPEYRAAYDRVSRGRRQTLRPGDTLPLKPGSAVQLRCVAARAVVLGPKARCDQHPPSPKDPTDNARSVAMVLQFGNFRAFFGGDITHNVEHALVCPVNRVGEVDLYQADHHGLDSSNHPVLLERLNPTVIVMHNGKRKGGGERTFTAFRRAKALQAVFQLHKSLRYPRWNSDERFIANVGPDETGRPIVVEVLPGASSFTVRLGFDGPAHRFPIRTDKAPPAPVASEQADQP